MMKLPKTAPLFLLGLALAACDHGPEALFAELSQDRFGRTDRPTDRPEALSAKEVSFHLRMGLPEADLVAQAKKRGLAIYGDVQKALAEVKASPMLIAQLSAPEILLTKEEIRLYEKRQMVRKNQQLANQADSDAFVDQHRFELNQSLATARNQQIERQTTELSAKANRIREEQRRERFSWNSNSPYQRRQQELDQISKEITALNKQR